MTSLLRSDIEPLPKLNAVCSTGLVLMLAPFGEEVESGAPPGPAPNYPPTVTTFFASGPFCPSATSNSTFAPSASDLKPSPAIEL